MEDGIWGNGPLHCTLLPPVISYTKLSMWISLSLRPSLSISSSLIFSFSFSLFFHFISLHLYSKQSLFSTLCSHDYLSLSKLVCFSPTLPPHQTQSSYLSSSLIFMVNFLAFALSLLLSLSYSFNKLSPSPMRGTLSPFHNGLIRSKESAVIDNFQWD